MGMFKEDDNLAILNYIEKLDEQSFLGYLQSVVFDAPSIGHDSINVYFTARNDVNYFSHVLERVTCFHPIIRFSSVFVNTLAMNRKVIPYPYWKN